MKNNKWAAAAGMGGVLFCLVMAAYAPEPTKAQSSKNVAQVAEVNFVEVHRYMDEHAVCYIAKRPGVADPAISCVAR